MRPISPQIQPADIYLKCGVEAGGSCSLSLFTVS